ncbi:related to alpha/beta hydrolase [Cephalotrichum gorgonifer]|uniref:Related to alpha/beta hydrolase n=1 Tax=Cephalotrichum gorgonifer TaxID=2041049 RepID=A0AAE8SRQ7_9PEZI|nr:related to alpha/beta hydrolase [Cephalotrichum gorgonifer]
MASQTSNDTQAPQTVTQQGAPETTGPGFRGPLFPLSYKDAAYQWWTGATPVNAERAVLSHIPYLREAAEYFASEDQDKSSKFDPFGTRIWKTQLVKLPGKNRALNEYSVERVGEDVKETLVMLHGYGAGLGFFYQNYEPLTRIPGWRLYSLDMLGMGNSSRPPFKIHATDKRGKISEAEAWFVDALEEWRIERKIEKFTLLGHSLGGYLAVSYALKYPGHLKKLILASPAGIPENPYAINDDLPEPDQSTMEAEFTADQQSVTEGHTTTSTRSSNSSSRPTPPGPPQPLRRLRPWLVWLWDANFSPFSFVRNTGPLGPKFVSGWSSRRFNHLPEAEARSLHDYSFSIFKQKGSGEYALPYLLAPGAYGRDPVVNRIHRVGRQVISEEEGRTIRETGIPIVMMYGENDWMDVAGGFAAEQKLNDAREKSLLSGTDEERARENGQARVVVISKAGHHLYLDNSAEFNEVMKKEMEATMAEGK